MPTFGSPFSGLAKDQKISAEELLRLLQELSPDEAGLYAKGAKEVEEKIRK